MRRRKTPAAGRWSFADLVQVNTYYRYDGPADGISAYVDQIHAVSGEYLKEPYPSGTTTRVNGLAYEGAGWKEYAQFQIAMPKSWNEGTVAFIPHWTAAGGSGTIHWYVQCVALGDSDALDASWGTAAGITDTLITAHDNHVGSEITPVTIGGTPAEGDLAICEVYRDGEVDSHAIDATLLAIKMLYVVDATNDN